MLILIYIFKFNLYYVREHAVLLFPIEDLSPKYQCEQGYSYCNIATAIAIHIETISQN